ncbi:MAG: hypothetical protein CMN30_24935 [Sandaracinus sp.]|nr:hypothetical protein [Sandaracinus sp.]
MLLSLREPLTVADDDSVAGRLLRSRRALYSVSFSSNPSYWSTVIDAWLAQQRAEARRDRHLFPSGEAYLQLAVLALEAPALPVPGAVHLGFDLIDGTDSYLLDYGEWPVSVPPSNDAGLWPDLLSAQASARSLAEAWSLTEVSLQIWSVFTLD